MNEINTKEYADQFCNMLQSLMSQFGSVGNWNWGNPAGQSDPLPTYEIITPRGEKVWCCVVEYVNAGTGVPNRKGILATFPVQRKQSLGSVMSAMIPYKFSKTFNTRAYCKEDAFEIRNYGKVTVGRAGIKKDDFFRYMEKQSSESVFMDEEDKKYILAYHYKGTLSRDSFARQTYRLTKMMADFKEQYRSK